jgi:hypothetical protein
VSNTNIKTGEENAEKLRIYIKKNNKFPIYRKRLNKTQLLNDLDIGLAARQNKDIKQQLISLDQKLSQNTKLLPETDNSDTVKNRRDYISALEQKLAIAEAHLAEYKTGLFAESFLVKTGKLIRQPSYHDSLDLKGN